MSGGGDLGNVDGGELGVDGADLISGVMGGGGLGRDSLHLPSENVGFVRDDASAISFLLPFSRGWI